MTLAEKGRAKTRFRRGKRRQPFTCFKKQENPRQEKSPWLAPMEMAP
jgi:hypothetical protein